MIWQMIEDWFRGILTDGILSNLSGLFDSVNTEVGEIATQVGTTPAGWNAGIFNMIRSLSENVIVPIAGVIITFVMCYELMTYVTHSEAGEGLIFYGNVILPFIDRFPKDTELYRVMTTKPGEVSA